MTEPTDSELRLMQGLAQQVTAERPELLNSEATVGELAWFFSRNVDAIGASWRRRLWFADGALVGWGWAHLPYRIAGADGSVSEVTDANLTWQVHPRRPDLLADILDWYDEVAGAFDRQIIVQSSDQPAQEMVSRHGYEVDAEAAGDAGSWVTFMTRDLVDLAEPALPAGFRFTTAAEVPAAWAVKAHRDAWPRSRLDEAAFARVQGTWPYRADLHALIAAPDGTPAASAIIWLDEATQTAEFEPVGTHREFRRRGLGTALQWRGMHLARAAGATRMFVACLGAPSNPAALGMYRGVGFRALTTDRPYVKRAPAGPAGHSHSMVNQSLRHKFSFRNSPHNAVIYRHPYRQMIASESPPGWQPEHRRSQPISAHF